MLSNLQGYIPENIEFVVDDAIMEKFPDHIFDGATDIKEVIKIINENFMAIYPEKEVARRKMDDFEKNEIREEYCQIEENELPDALKEQLDAYDEAKRMKKEADENLASVRKRIRDLADRVREGEADYKLSSKNTVRIALCGHYLYYSWVNGKMQLVRGEHIPEWDSRKFWAQDDKNRKAMKELFGIEFPEIEKPEGVDDTNPEDIPDEDEPQASPAIGPSDDETDF